eukprot:s718_g13.t1
MNLPPTPEERPHVPRLLAPPESAVVAGGEMRDETMEVSAEAGVATALGAAVPRTPQDVPQSSVAAGSSSLEERPAVVTSALVHPREESGDVDRPSKHQRILAVFEHEDEPNETWFDGPELDELESYDYDLDERDFSTSNDADLLEQLCLPFSTLEPSLSGDELLKLDLIADQLEISRLRNMGVLIPTSEYEYGSEKPKSLTTRMVRTWRDKMVNGRHVWLRRSRYVAREFAWLSPDRQDLFSPASSVLTVRLLPCLYMKWKAMGYVLCSIDIGDAFLTVNQKELTEVVFVDALGASTTYVLGKVLPGQRNGSQMWHEAFSNFLQTELKIFECEAYPCLLKSQDSECVLLLHVDDVLCLVKREYLRDVLEPALKNQYKITLEVLEKEGDELTFLKRRHMLLSENELAIQSHPKHLERLFDLLKINKGLKPKNVPVHPLLDEPDKSNELAPDKAKIYRSCIGILLYIASEYIECVGRIRHVSVRILWIQREVKLGLICPATVSTRDNTSDLGTKRLNRDHMRYLMFLCKIYNLSESAYVVHEVAEKIHQSDAMSEGIKMLKRNGTKSSSAKSIMRVLLLGALGLPAEATLPMASWDVGYGSFTFFAFYMTIICLIAGFSFFLGTQLDVLKGEYRRIRMHATLKKVLKILKRAKISMTGSHGEEEENDDDESSDIKSETQSEIETRETNELLTAREHRLQCEWDEAEIRGDANEMFAIYARDLQ